LLVFFDTNGALFAAQITGRRPQLSCSYSHTFADCCFDSITDCDMALPKMMIRLFAPKQAASSYSASGSLVLPLDEVHALAEWLLSQAGEYDSYLGTNVIRLLAFEYLNRSKAGNAYRTIQLRDPAGLSGPGANEAGSIGPGPIGPGSISPPHVSAMAPAADPIAVASTHTPQELPF
jgi:hypothetical protein